MLSDLDILALKLLEPDCELFSFFLFRHSSLLASVSQPLMSLDMGQGLYPVYIDINIDDVLNWNHFK